MRKIPHDCGPVIATCNRVFVASLMLAAIGVLSGPATAQQKTSTLDAFLRDTSIEMREKFDIDEQRRASYLRDTAPTFSAQSVYRAEQAIARYEGIVARGGWPQVPGEQRLKLGMRNAAVIALKRRLFASGDLSARSNRSAAVFDSYVERAVRRFQKRHGIRDDGIVGKATFAQLNVPAYARLRQLRINLERLRAMAGFLGDRYVFVNIPAAQVETVSYGAVVGRHTAVVGKIDRQTPLLRSRIHEINFNPYWHVPASIVKRDLIPRMINDPAYLTDNRIHVFDHNGTEILPQDIDWFSDEATRYLYRQEPGAQNSMGHVKINFRNKHAVYMHDTPSKTLFGEDYRFHSSGCVRVDKVKRYVTWLLQNTPEWDAHRVNEMFRSGERLDVKLRDPVALYFEYLTAWADGQGMVHFREDIYNRDNVDELAASEQSDLLVQ